VDGSLIGYRISSNRLLPLPEKAVARHRRSVGMVFQHFNLFPHLTALENVAYAPVATGRQTRPEAESSAHELLRKVGLASKAAAYPAQLSGGQQQRVAIARALAMRPKLMLLDEPTSALDPALVRDVLDVIRALASEAMTMLIVTHELGFAREVCDAIAYFAHGRVTEFVPPDQFFSDPRTDDARDYLGRRL
jgi:polar amino acid transport system ATP-binding protein